MDKNQSVYNHTVDQLVTEAGLCIETMLREYTIGEIIIIASEIERKANNMKVISTWVKHPNR